MKNVNNDIKFKYSKFIIFFNDFILASIDC